MHFSYSSVQQQEFMRRAESLLEYMKRAKQDGQQQQQPQQQAEPGQMTPQDCMLQIED
jgi:hypothetical protein